MSLGASAADDCLRLTRVDVETSPVLSQSQAQRLMSPFFGSCLDSKLIGELLGAVSDYLTGEGYVTTRPYLQEQDVSDGQVEIRILPGRIEKIIDADSGERNGRVATAFLFSDEILNLRDLESSLEMIERLGNKGKL